MLLVLNRTVNPHQVSRWFVCQDAFASAFSARFP